MHFELQTKRQEVLQLMTHRLCAGTSYADGVRVNQSQEKEENIIFFFSFPFFFLLFRIFLCFPLFSQRLRMVTTKITTLHHKQFVDWIMNRSVQTLRQGGCLVRRRSMVGVAATLMTTLLATTTFVLTYVEASFRAV